MKATYIVEFLNIFHQMIINFHNLQMLRRRRPLQHRGKTLDLKTFKAHIFRTESSSQAQLDFEDQNAGPTSMESNLKFFHSTKFYR